MTLTETRQENTIQISIEGRVDTSSSPELQSAVLLAFQKTSKLILDFTQVAYISSAGLRALLIGQKTANSKGGSLIITNVSPVVMEVFEVTGFAEILNIE